MTAFPGTPSTDQHPQEAQPHWCDQQQSPTPPAGQRMSSSLKNQVPFENILFFSFLPNFVSLYKFLKNKFYLLLFIYLLAVLGL